MSLSRVSHICKRLPIVELISKGCTGEGVTIYVAPGNEPHTVRSHLLGDERCFGLACKCSIVRTSVAIDHRSPQIYVLSGKAEEFPAVCRSIISAGHTLIAVTFTGEVPKDISEAAVVVRSVKTYSGDRTGHATIDENVYLAHVVALAVLVTQHSGRTIAVADLKKIIASHPTNSLSLFGNAPLKLSVAMRYPIQTLPVNDTSSCGVHNEPSEKQDDCEDETSE